ncbi:MAG: zinc metallopeptidase [Bacteroidota bacterium]|nr:zinc metallopeptidase [Bacteroidota bacterium]
MLLVIGIVTMLISMWVSWKLKRKFKEYSQIGLYSGMSGAEAAEKMLRDNGIYDVKIISVDGQLTDHYNPATKTVNLSYDVFYGRNAAAVAVASHECGHAVQHAKAYMWLGLRSAMVPAVNISATILNFVNILLLFGGGFVFYSTGGVSDTILMIIIAANLGLTVFSVVTLPVEFDASSRALAWMTNRGVVTSKEHEMAKDALNWAAMTYVVAALGSLAQLAYWVMIFMGRRDD